MGWVKAGEVRWSFHDNEGSADIVIHDYNGKVSRCILETAKKLHISRRRRLCLDPKLESKL